jgi:hypothetical protein
VAALAELLFDGTEIRREGFRVALLVALQIGATFFKIVAGQTTAILQDAEVGLMDEVRETSPPCLDPGRGEIDEPPLAPDIVDAVAFRA